MRRQRRGLESEPLGRALRQIAVNRAEGASALAIASVDAIGKALAGWRRLDDSELRHRVRALATAWRRLQPAMGFFLETSGELEEISSSRAPPWPRLDRWVRTWRHRLEHEHGRVVREAGRRFPPGTRCLTISRSSLVRDALLSLRPSRRPLEVVALRSHPGGEGAQLVRELRRGGLRARLLEDAALPRWSERVDLVLIGADAVLPGGWLVHKAGTRRLCAWARRRKIRVIVLTGRSKMVTRGPWRRPTLGARFDRTPIGWIDSFWTDRGVLAPARAPSGGR